MKYVRFKDAVIDCQAVKDFPNENRTKQSFLDECDVNNIVRKYDVHGIVPESRGSLVFGDYSDVPSYQDACNIVKRAEDQFLSLDAETRSRFANNPEKFLEFVSDSKNLPEMYRLGLAIEPKADVTVNNDLNDNGGTNA